MSSQVITNNKQAMKATWFLENARSTLSLKDFLLLLSELITEWHATGTFSNLFYIWNTTQKHERNQTYSSLHILCFNVHGLRARWGEVCLLSSAHCFDIITLGEAGHVDFSLLGDSFDNYRIFYQADENAHGGVLVMIRNGIPASKVTCPTPNVCTIHIHYDQTIRIITLYAPGTKTWQWTDLSSLITGQCLMIGDFNSDIERDSEKAERFIEWLDVCYLDPIIPDSDTSNRSDRTIDYALVAGVDLKIQTYERSTTSDHKPLIMVISCDTLESCEGSRTTWPIFSLMLSYMSHFWENEWGDGSLDVTYERFIQFLALLKDRCTMFSPRKLA